MVTALVLLGGCAPRAVFVTDRATEVYYGGAEAIGRSAREATSFGDRIVHERIETLDRAGESLSRISDRHRETTLIVPAILSNIAHERLSDHEAVVVIVGAEPDNERFASVTFGDGTAVEELARVITSVHRDRYRDEVAPVDNDSDRTGVPALFLLSDESNSTIRERSHRIYDALEESGSDAGTIERRRFFSEPGDDELRRAIREVADSGSSVVVASISRGGSIVEEESDRHNLALAAAYEVGAAGPKSDRVVSWFKRPLEEVFRVAMDLSHGERTVVEMELGTADR